MHNTGDLFSLEDDNMILQINSPKESISGPYAVVFKNLAIVALNWDQQPRLGIRWFWGNGGNPFSSGHGTWLVIPPTLTHSMLSGIPLDHAFRRKVDDFLSGVISGHQINN
ncbi:MAG: hypothetical protein EAZ81_13475 [Verrucomicrobia bacterium]|nr:MAG: hypothetical protein EAZ81_13475 [Verrucomicrobiota bacterium]